LKRGHSHSCSARRMQGFQTRQQDCILLGLGPHSAR
jgi:hypothetical protein